MKVSNEDRRRIGAFLLAAMLVPGTMKVHGTGRYAIDGVDAVYGSVKHDPFAQVPTVGFRCMMARSANTVGLEVDVPFHDGHDTRRYAHSQAWIRTLAERFGYHVQTYRKIGLKSQDNEQMAGGFYTLLDDRFRTETANSEIARHGQQWAKSAAK